MDAINGISSLRGLSLSSAESKLKEKKEVADQAQLESAREVEPSKEQSPQNQALRVDVEA